MDGSYVTEQKSSISFSSVLLWHYCLVGPSFSSPIACSEANYT